LSDEKDFVASIKEELPEEYEASETEEEEEEEEPEENND